MTEVVRLYYYKSLLSDHRAVSADALIAKLEISRVTLKRNLAKLRNQLTALEPGVLRFWGAFRGI